jgi:hypothetical protein
VTDALLVTAGDRTDVQTPASPEALARAREVFGLDAAPPSGLTPKPRAVPSKRVGTTGKGKSVHPWTHAKRLLAHTPPPEWERALRALSPHSDTHSWLRFVWYELPDAKPGDGRWTLYECVPDALIPTGKRMMLRDTPYWDLPIGQRQGRGQMVTAVQWELYRLERVEARPFWILQGNQGGTPATFTEMEQKMLRVKQQPTNPPALGALPFAPWDARVERAVRQRDRLKRLNGDIEALRRNASPEAVQAELDAAEKAFRREMLTWWADQMQEQSDFIAWYSQKCESDRTLRRASREEFMAAQLLEESFVEHGIIPHVHA